MLAKVPLHPLAKSFSLMEACCRLLYTLLYSLKIVFFFTSCQPNWSLVLDVVFGGQDEVHMAITLIDKTKLRTQPKIFQETSLYMETSINCAVLPILSMIVFAPCMVFFVMSCLLRFYIFVARPVNAHQGNLVKPTQIIGLNFTGILVSFLYVGWILSINLQAQHQSPFTRACEASDVNTNINPWTKHIYAQSLIILNAVALTLSIKIVYKVKKSTTSSSDSEHIKLVVYTLSHTVGFVFMLITATLAKVVNSTLMNKVSISIHHC